MHCHIREQWPLTTVHLKFCNLHSCTKTMFYRMRWCGNVISGLPVNNWLHGYFLIYLHVYAYVRVSVSLHFREQINLLPPVQKDRGQRFPFNIYLSVLLWLYQYKGLILIGPPAIPTLDTCKKANYLHWCFSNYSINANNKGSTNIDRLVAFEPLSSRCALRTVQKF